LGFLPACARDYGDICRYHIGPVTAYLLNNPEYIEYVLVGNSRNFVKGRLLQGTRPLLGDGLLTSEGDTWLTDRRLVQPAFHRERVNTYAGIMLETVERVLSTWRDGEVRDLLTEMKNLARQIVARSLFNAQVEDQSEPIAAALQAVWEQFTTRLGSGQLIPEYLPTPRNLSVRAAIRRLDAAVDSIIRQRRLSSERPDDLLSMLLAARDLNGSPMPDRWLRDQVMTLFVAGHETTALALTWTWVLLAENPQVETRLLAEIQDVCGERLPAAGDLSRLRYTEMVLKEALRLYPPVWTIARVAAGDCEIGGYYVPAGTSVTISQWVTHRDPRFFDDPEAFRPERWASEEATGLPGFAYFPFGGGPRGCIGYSFAMMEALLLIATILPRFHFSLVPGHPVVPWPSITLYPRYGVKAVVEERIRLPAN
jgi:cytochrome P450